MSFSQVIVASTSAIKLAAVTDWVFGLDKDWTKPSDCIIKVQPREPGKTSAKQPVGVRQARFCADERVRVMLQAKEELLNDCVCAIVVIENYIQYNCDRQVWQDFVLVVIHVISADDNVQFSNTSTDGIDVPRQFEPRASKDTADDDFGDICDVTVGQLVHAAEPSVPSDDWFKYANAANPTRKEQILRTLRPLSVHFQDIAMFF